MAPSKAERITLLGGKEEGGGGGTTGAAQVVEAIRGGESRESLDYQQEGASGAEEEEEWGGVRSSSSQHSRWGLARVAGVAVFTTLALALVIVLANTSRWQWVTIAGRAAEEAALGGVALEVEPVGHVIWLGSKLPNVKRVFLHRNQELLHEAGWKLKLW
jgi:hypothetical protein